MTGTDVWGLVCGLFAVGLRFLCGWFTDTGTRGPQFSLFENSWPPIFYCCRRADADWRAGTGFSRFPELRPPT